MRTHPPRADRVPLRALEIARLWLWWEHLFLVEIYTYVYTVIPCDQQICYRGGNSLYNYEERLDLKKKKVSKEISCLPGS